MPDSDPQYPIDPTKRKALFVSTISPGLWSGGFQCTLAFLEAVSELHKGRVVYAGAPFARGYSGDVAMEGAIFLEGRSRLDVLRDWLRFGHVDHVACAPEVRAMLQQAATEGNGLLYINGERGGHLAEESARLGIPSVIIYHNFGPEYIRHHSLGWSLRQMIHSKLMARSGVAGYRNSTVRLFLTKEDRLAYRQLAGRADLDASSFDRMFFGCREWSGGRGNAGHPESLLFCITADLSRYENATGVVDFLEDVWPELAKEFPVGELVVAGKQPMPCIRDAVVNLPRVLLVESPGVEDMSALLRRATVSIATSTRGSGIKVRVAESLSYGVPVLAVEHCLRGYESVSRDVLKVYRDGGEAVAQVRAFLQQEAGWRRARCLEEYETQLGFAAGVKKLGEAVGAGVMSRKGGRGSS